MARGKTFFFFASEAYWQNWGYPLSGDLPGAALHRNSSEFFSGLYHHPRIPFFRKAEEDKRTIETVCFRLSHPARPRIAPCSERNLFYSQGWNCNQSFRSRPAPPLSGHRSGVSADLGLRGIAYRDTICARSYYSEDLQKQCGTKKHNFSHPLEVDDDLPVGRGRALLSNSNRILDGAIGGWELGSLWKMQTGAPITISMYPLHSAYVKPHIQKDNGYIRLLSACVEQWEESTNSQGQTVYTMTPLTYDTDTTCSNGADFENPEQWMPGANGVYSARTLRWQQFDANLSKNFSLFEGFSLQVRMEAFNALNHPVWNQGPDTNIQDSTFGVVARGASGQNNLPRQMQLSVKIVW